MIVTILEPPDSIGKGTNLIIYTSNCANLIAQNLFETNVV